MGQRGASESGRIFRGPLLAAVCVLFISAGSCDRQRDRSGTVPTTSRSIKAASLVPAATDLLIGMRAGDHLVAVSNWDSDRPETAGLPKVGDYRSIDWERIAALRPDVMIVQFRADKMPAGLDDRARQLGISLVNVKNNSLDDLYATLRKLGDAVREPAKAELAEVQLRARLEAIRTRTKAAAPVPTLITRAEPMSSLACVGGGNYLDEVLTIAGGRNVLAGGDNSYPTIDREKLIELDPHAVLVLLPGASPQVIAETKKFWQSIPQVRAVRDDRVFILTDPYLLLPSLNVSKVAEQFAAKLHSNLMAPTPGAR